MICIRKGCTKKLKGMQKKFCSTKCQNTYNWSEGTYVKTDTSVPRDTCKWCMDSEEGFCCDEHESKYNNFRTSCDSELNREKPELTEEQEKGFEKLRKYLTG